MDCLLEPIQCTKCFEQLKTPVVLPCGNAICEKHQNKDRDENNSIYCSVCDLHHAIPKEGFVRNLALEKLIEQKIDRIDLGNEYHSTYEKLENFSELIEKLEKIKSNPDEKIYNKIGKLRNKIDLKREELKSQIDKDALSIIKQLDEYEAECKANIPSIKAEIEDNTKLNGWKEDLDRWRKQMRTFEKDIDKWKKIHEEASSTYNEMHIEYYKFHDDLFLNRLYDYKVLKLFIGNHSDMIKNHSLSYVVKNVTQTIKNGEDINIYTEGIRSFGIDWYLNVFTLTHDDAIKYVGVFLNVEGNFCKEEYDISFDIAILHRTDPSKNIKKSRKNSFIESEGCGTSVIKLNDIINNDGFFDAENDCFTVQVIIKSVEIKSIEEDTE